MQLSPETQSNKIEKKIVLTDNLEAMAMLGHHDEVLRLVNDEFDSKITARGNEIAIDGEPADVNHVTKLFDELLYLYRSGNAITIQDVKYTIRMIKEGSHNKLRTMFESTVMVTNRGRQIRAKTLGQHFYLEAIKKNHITFGIGPAGTGKTYLAVAMAVSYLKNKEVERIILTRPAIEAGEKLGFLPGDLQDKVDPYLRPLYDALGEILGAETFEKYMAKNIIEVAPLAYMRGRTLNDSFIILDEAQNTTPQQMKMFLTRMGFGAKMVITGDITQIDLPHHSMSGLKSVEKIFADIPGIAVMNLNESDVVRHEIVSRIIRAYERYEALK